MQSVLQITPVNRENVNSNTSGNYLLHPSRSRKKKPQISLGERNFPALSYNKIPHSRNLKTYPHFLATEQFGPRDVSEAAADQKWAPFLLQGPRGNSTLSGHDSPT